VFFGRFEHSVDAKGRTSLPARFRQALGAGDQQSCRIVVAPALDAYCMAFSVEKWGEYMNRLLALPESDDADYAREWIVGGAAECEVDKLGRLVLPQHLREHAGIEGDLVWVGDVSHIKVWSKAAQDARKATLTPERRGDLKRSVAGLKP
jgi:MraZ protein